MSCCPPSCVVPCSTPSVGFGSCGIYGGSYGGGYGGVPASALGLTSGANVACVSQLPASELTIQPPSFTMVIPGPVLAASCEPLAVGGYTPCASGSGYRGSYGGGYRGVCQSKPFCVSPC